MMNRIASVCLASAVVWFIGCDGMYPAPEPEPVVCEAPGEPNNEAGTATPLPLAGVDWDFFARFDIPGGLRLCAGDEDWFLVPASQLDWPEPNLFIRARIAESGLCGAGCGDVVLPDAPANTMTVQVFHAPTMERIAEVTSDRGNVWITDDDPRYVDDLLIRISAPADAAYDYILRMDMRSELAEDECEC